MWLLESEGSVLRTWPSSGTLDRVKIPLFDLSTLFSFRFLLHGCLLLCSNVSPRRVAAILKPPPPDDEVQEFLVEHLCVNLQQVAKQLGKNEDEAQILLHKVIQRVGNGGAQKSGSNPFNSKATRESWEHDFASKIIAPETEALSATLNAFREAVQMETALAENALEDTLNEQPGTEFSSDDNLLCQPHLWGSHARVDLSNVAFKVGGHNLLKVRCPNFARMLENQKVLAEMARLPDILAMHEMLSRKLGGRIESNEVRIFVNLRDVQA